MLQRPAATRLLLFAGAVVLALSYGALGALLVLAYRTGWMEVVSVVSMLGTVAAGGGVLWAARAVVAAEKSTTAQLLWQILSEWQSDEIRRALRDLYAFRDARPNTWSDDFEYLLRVDRKRRLPQPSASGSQVLETTGTLSELDRAMATLRLTADDLDASRRRVSQFFWKLARFCAAGLLEEKVVGNVLGRYHADTYLDLVDLLDHAHAKVINKGHDLRARRFYKRAQLAGGWPDYGVGSSDSDSAADTASKTR